MERHYAIKLESRHSASVSCRIIPGTDAIAYIGAKNALDEAVESAANEHEVNLEFDPIQGEYTITFLHDSKPEAVQAAASTLAKWLRNNDKFVPL